MSFLVTGFVVGLLGGSLGSGGEHYDFHTPFLEEISGWDGCKKTNVAHVVFFVLFVKGGRTTSGKFGSMGWMI